MAKEILTTKIYFMGRDENPEYSPECTGEVRANATDLCKRVNNLLNHLAINSIKVSSGWRPSKINGNIGGAKRSLHMEGKAVDIADPDGKLAALLLKHVDEESGKSNDVLTLYGLWMENPTATKGWVHLDSGMRSARLKKIFNP